MSQIRFQSIEDFKDCLNRGGEIEFLWDGVHYGVVRYGIDDKITIYEAYQPGTEVAYASADEVLQHLIGTNRLGEVITQLKVLDRTV